MQRIVRSSFLGLLAIAGLTACAPSTAQASEVRVPAAAPIAPPPTRVRDELRVGPVTADTFAVRFVADSTCDTVSTLRFARRGLAAMPREQLAFRASPHVGALAHAPRSTQNEPPPRQPFDLRHLLIFGIGMTALAGERDTQSRSGRDLAVPLGAAKKVYKGGIVVMKQSTGYAQAAATATGLTALGRARDTYDNTNGADGDVTAIVERGVFYFGNSASTDQIGKGDIGKTCYLVDDQTVAKTDNSGARSAAGTIRDVDANGVWVEF